MAKPLPHTADELAHRLASIFPSLPRDFGSSGESVLADAEPTYQSVLREFSYFFARDLDQYADRSLRRFAELVAQGVAAGGELEAAFRACLVDALDELGARERFGPFLATALQAAGLPPLP